LINSNALLLLDLDGVLVTDGRGDVSIGHEILRVYPEAPERLVDLQMPVGILTHRRRFEADQSLLALNIEYNQLAAFYTANDLLKSALSHGLILPLLRKGMRKSLILPLISNSLGLQAYRLALIDDNLENLKDMVEHGIGLAILAPQAKLSDGILQCLDLDEALKVVKLWAKSPHAFNKTNKTSSIVRLGSISKPISDLHYSGVVMQRSTFDFFGHFRKISRKLRQFFFR
jgi:hypothetical protein